MRLIAFKNQKKPEIDNSESPICSEDLILNQDSALGEFNSRDCQDAARVTDVEDIAKDSSYLCMIFITPAKWIDSTINEFFALLIPIKGVFAALEITMTCSRNPASPPQYQCRDSVMPSSGSSKSGTYATGSSFGSSVLSVEA